MQQKEFEHYLERARRFYNRLERHLFAEQLPLTAEFRHSVDPVPFAQRLDGEYRPIREGERWGDKWESAWFHLTAELPESWANRPLALEISFNGESLLFDDSGVPKFGFSAGSVYGVHYRKEICQLPPRAAGKAEFWIEAAGNALFGLRLSDEPELNDPPPHDGRCTGIAEKMRIGLFNTEIWHLRLDLEILLDLLGEHPVCNRRNAQIVAACRAAFDAYAENPANAAPARAALAPVLKTPACASAMTVTGIGHAHIDTGWLWPVRETIRKCARTFASQLELIEKYPGYVFGASTPQHYAFVKRHYPELYEKIKAAVAAGSWEPLGGMWVEADCNLPNGESLVRQFLHGKNFFMDEFGFDVKNLWIPDVFGYSAALPQIIRRSGCNTFLTQKLSWNETNRFPRNTFRWRGIDGTEILTHFPPEDTYNAVVEPSALAAAEAKFTENDILDEFMSLFGIGDGGGGPKEEYLERALRLADIEGSPKFRFGRADRFFERLAECADRLAVWSGELYFECHRGTLTTQARTKRNNRRLEELLVAVEFFAGLQPDETYPAAELDRLWKVLLLNQFHDIIPGSSIHKVYEVTEREHAEALRDATLLAERMAAQLFSADADALTLFNSLPCRYRGGVVLPESWRDATLLDPAGQSVAVQNGRALVDLPAAGFLTLRRSGAGRDTEYRREAGLILENDLIRYTFDRDGRLLSAFDKQLEYEFIPADAPANRLNLYVDRPNRHEAWDIEGDYARVKCDEAHSVSEPREFTGAIASGIEFELAIGNSTIRQRVTLRHGARRLDFATRVHWNESRRLLRVAFPTTIRTPESTADIQYGYLRRPTAVNTSWDEARFEVAAQKYADLSEYDRGVALLNDCKYGHRLYGSTIDLALLRSPKFPDWEADRGDHEFTYALLPHTGALVESEVMTEAACLNRMPLLFPGRSGAAEFPIRAEEGPVRLVVFKKAEKEACRIIRLVETAGRSSKCILHTTAALEETNLLEWTQEGRFEPVDGRIELNFRPFEIRTFKLK